MTSKIIGFADLRGPVGCFAEKKGKRIAGTVCGRRSAVRCSQVDGRTLNVIWANPTTRGSFGVVYFGTASDGSEIVCKCPVESSLGRSLWSTERHVNEKLALVREDQQYWPGFIGSTVVPRSATLPRGVAPIGLVWERVSQHQTLESSLSAGAGFLEQAMRRSGKMITGDSGGVRAQLFKAVMKELLLAVQAMHEQGILHRDIKPENILISDDTQRPLQVIDFGSACDWSSWTKVGLGDATLDPTYAAPERKLSLFSAHKFDVFSLGVLGLRILLPSLSNQQLFSEIVTGSLTEEDYHVTAWALRTAEKDSSGSLATDCRLLTQPGPATDALKLLRGMLQKKAGDRFTVQECLKRL